MNTPSNREHERRHYSRSDATLVVSYRPKDVPHGYDISQSKNVSQGGMLLTTNKSFTNHTFLDVMIRLPFMPEALEVTGRVVGCEAVVPDLIYETRVEFVGLTPSFFERLGDFLRNPS